MAHLHDAKRLAAIAEETFRDTVAAASTPEDTALHCRTSYGEVIQAEEIANPNMVTLLCERGEILAGFAQLPWSKAPSCVVAEAPGEIQRLYVARECHGQGIAHDLTKACSDEMTAHRSDLV
jgi:ribosomal protein S18 acetylase RimI-like enzyme